MIDTVYEQYKYTQHNKEITASDCISVYAMSLICHIASARHTLDTWVHVDRNKAYTCRTTIFDMHK